MLVIFVTTLPPLRQKHFNLFYFTHLFAIVAVIVICLHASTMFYCTAPGIAMWVLDWGMRLYELREKLDGKIVTLGNGWYCLTLRFPRGRLDGCACTSPLAHFYIHHSGSSIRELHPFTTITHLATENSVSPKSAHDFPIQFLFRKHATSLQPEATPKMNGSWVAPRILARLQRPKAQWTEKVAGLVDKEIPRPSEEADPVGSARLWPIASTSSRKSSLNPVACLGNSHAMANVSLRLEGPYFTPADPMRYNTVVCLVAGTGVSGAIAIAGAFSNIARETAEACDIGGRHTASKESSHFALEVRIHLTAKDRPRIDMYKTLSSIRSIDLEGDIWVYLSGPNRFIEAGENACKNVAGVDWYAARWDI
ncbi:MAG: hypothetical protein M1836_001487 [Candelina mexicana]|nr:MAG: hypothetical protein M1836_001487 [Candelina mexicana]